MHCSDFVVMVSNLRGRIPPFPRTCARGVRAEAYSYSRSLLFCLSFRGELRSHTELCIARLTSNLHRTSNNTVINLLL